EQSVLFLPAQRIGLASCAFDVLELGRGGNPPPDTARFVEDRYYLRQLLIYRPHHCRTVKGRPTEPAVFLELLHGFIVYVDDSHVSYVRERRFDKTRNAALVFGLELGEVPSGGLCKSSLSVLLKAIHDASGLAESCHSDSPSGEPSRAPELSTHSVSSTTAVRRSLALDICQRVDFARRG